MTSPRYRLRAVVPRRDQLGSDAVAGVPGVIASVPDGMAASVLGGVAHGTRREPGSRIILVG